MAKGMEPLLANSKKINDETTGHILQGLERRTTLELSQLARIGKYVLMAIIGIQDKTKKGGCACNRGYTA